MEAYNDKKIPDDEIDIKSIGKRMFAFISYPFFLWFANIKTTLIFVCFAIALSIVLKLTIPKSYKANFIIRPNERNERIHLKSLGDLVSLLNLQDYNAIAREIKTTPEFAKSIHDVNFISNAFSKNRADSSNTTEIELQMDDYKKLVPLQNAILNYLESNSYYLRIKAFQKNSISLKTELINKEIILLDSLKKLQLSSYDRLKVSEQNSIYLKDLINPTSTYTLSLERMNQKIGLIGQLEFIDNYQLVKPVVITERHFWPPRILMLCVYLIPFFLIICFVFLHIKTKKN